MNTQEIYSTKERETILDYLLKNPEEEININALARKLKLSPGHVHHYLKLLKKHGLFKDKKLIDNAETKILRVLQNINIINKSKIVEFIIKNVKKVSGIGIYGSWAKGANKKSSDLDLWVKTEHELNDLELAKLNKELSLRVKTQVEVLVATPKRMQHLKEKTESLYHSLFNSMTLWGQQL